MRSLFAFVALVLLVLAAGLHVARADNVQTAKLDHLFAQLRDPATGSNVLRIEPQIWAIWMSEGSSAENDSLANATAAMNLGAFELAENQLNELVGVSPNFAEAWNKRATLYFLMGRMNESLADIVKTLDIEPRHFGALSGRGMIYQRLGREAEAITAFQEALSIYPSMVGAAASLRELQKKLPEL